MSRFRFLRSMLVAGAACGLLLGGAMPAVAQQYDPSYDASQPANAGTDQSPGRVARPDLQLNLEVKNGSNKRK